MTLDDLKDRVNYYRQGQEQIVENRAAWTASTKALLMTTLNKFVEHFDLNCKVLEVNTYKNYEAVNLTFGNSRSGIVKEKENETKHFNKFGGTLSFSQSCNGRIDIIVIYPYIEEITDKTDKKVITQVSPADIDEAFIYRQVSRFLVEIIKWEHSPQIPTVGYKFPQKKTISTSDSSLKVVIGTAAESKNTTVK